MFVIFKYFIFILNLLVIGLFILLLLYMINLDFIKSIVKENLIYYYFRNKIFYFIWIMIDWSKGEEIYDKIWIISYNFFILILIRE